MTASQSEADRLALAYHKAGHAAVQHQLHRRFRSVSIEDTDNRMLGRAPCIAEAERFRPGLDIDTPTRRQLIRGEITILLAGYLAEERLTGVLDDERAEGDMQRVRYLASYAAKDEPNEAAAFIEWLRCRTVNLLKRPTCWAHVVALANHLLTVPKLDHRAALAAMGVDERLRREFPLIDPFR